MLNTDYTTWLMPFTSKDFPSIQAPQYDAEMIKAVQRALFFFKSAYNAKPSGWGITQEILDADGSGRLQKAFELFTAYEFLSNLADMFRRANFLQNFSSEEGESLSINSDQLKHWTSAKDFFYREAYLQAFEWVSSDFKKLGSPLIAAPYKRD